MSEPAVAPVTLEDTVIQANPEASPAPEPVATPTSATVNVGGITYAVTPELAASMAAEEKRRQDLHDAELLRISQTPAPIAPPIPEAPEPNITGYGDRIFENPDAVLAEVAENIEKKLESKYQKMEAEKEALRQQKEGLQDFYKDFFKKNKELKDDRELVETILVSNFERWKHMTPEQVSERLAEKAQETILRHRTPNQSPNSGLVLESGGQPVPGTPAPVVAADDGPKSLTEVIKLRQKARRDMTGLKTPNT